MSTYNEVIRILMDNDRNGDWDQILNETENDDYELATEIVISCLERIINEEGLEGDELQFYKNVLEKLK